LSRSTFSGVRQQKTAAPASPIYVLFDRQQKVRHSLDLVDGQAGGCPSQVITLFLFEPPMGGRLSQSNLVYTN